MEVTTSELLMLLGKLYVEKELIMNERDVLFAQLAEATNKESDESD